MTIINLTQHDATQEQRAAGVVDPAPEMQAIIRRELTFDEPPLTAEIIARACFLADRAVDLCRRHDTDRVMIGGAPFLMPLLHQALLERGLTPVYAFSRREVVEEPQPDGSVRKTAVFRHLGFVDFSSNITTT